MELEFHTTRQECLVPLVRELRQQSFTGDIPLGEDAQEIIALWGIPEAEAREITDRGMVLSGQIRCWALYRPEGDGLPQCAEGAVPFRISWDAPQGEGLTGRCLCRLAGLEGRSGARRVTVTASLSALGEVFTRQELESEAPKDPPSDLEILKRTVSADLVKSVTQETFTLDEDLELPGGAPQCARVLSWQLNPRITEQKVLGEKAVFKGYCQTHLVYMTSEDRLAVWDFEVPFSQFRELGSLYDETASVQTDLLIAGSSLTLPEPGRGLTLQCRLTAQCTVTDRVQMDLVTDLYAPRRQVSPIFRTASLTSRGPSREIRARLEAQFPMTGDPVDCTVHSGFPARDREGMAVSGRASAIWYDENGTLRGSTLPVRAGLELPEGWVLEPGGSEAVQWSCGGGNLSVRCPCSLTAAQTEKTELRVVRGAEASEKLPRSPGTPSLRLRPCTDSLWNLAKTNGSTPDAIRRANRLTAAPETGRLLVIPVV